ncbi:hypothetical protein [Enterococcus faecium]|uniref:hypothetical protein n=1 Tax=Enterococcus faecium TaxID=1352 RepID=UPI000B6F5234|nr:hypothetical protein [Enterococcus faecium]OTO44565.1 hypothetical protein A5841_002664 [Enterococcus faecium]
MDKYKTNTTSVSYTHLDVYKKILYTSTWMTYPRPIKRTHTSVSYTHLDVYKRQRLW